MVNLVVHCIAPHTTRVKERPLYRNIDDAGFTEEGERRCAHPGCNNSGEHKAPRSPNELRDYIYLCMPHIREYNKNWNYFKHMDGESVERYKIDATYGFRPTWNMNGRAAATATDRLKESVFAFLGDRAEAAPQRAAHAQLDRPTREALALFDLEWPMTETDLKKRYKELVKAHHPDRNPDDPEATPRLQRITEAYQLLRQAQERWL